MHKVHVHDSIEQSTVQVSPCCAAQFGTSKLSVRNSSIKSTSQPEPPNAGLAFLTGASTSSMSQRQPPHTCKTSKPDQSNIQLCQMLQPCLYAQQICLGWLSFNDSVLQSPPEPAAPLLNKPAASLCCHTVPGLTGTKAIRHQAMAPEQMPCQRSQSLCSTAVSRSLAAPAGFLLPLALEGPSSKLFLCLQHKEGQLDHIKRLGSEATCRLRSA